MMKKRICFLVMLAAFAITLFVGCSASPLVSEPIEVLYLGDSDATFAVDLLGREFMEIKKGDNVVDSKNYKIEGEKLVIYGSYLKTLSIGEHAFSLVTKGGNSEFKVNVKDSRVNKPLLSIRDGKIDKGEDVVEDLIINVDWGKGEFVSLSVGEETMQKDTHYTVSTTQIVLKGSAYKEWEDGEYTFTVKTTTGDGTFKIKVYDGTAVTMDFEDETLKSGENFGIAFSKREIVDGFDGKAARVTGNGTILYYNRPGFTDLDCTIKQGVTYEFKMQFKFADDGNGAIKPKQTQNGDWGVVGGRKDVVFCFGNGDWTQKAGYLTCNAEGVLGYTNIDGIADNSTITKDSNDIYTLTVSFVASANNQLQVATWMDIDFIVDNIDFRKAV